MKHILTSVAVVLCLFACQKSQSQKEGMTHTGFKYSILKDVEGALILPDQYVLLHTRVTTGDSLITDTRVNPGRPSIVKMDPEGSERRGSSAPVQDVLKLLSIGDSARLHYPVDSFPQVPERYREYKEVVYDLAILDVFETEQEVQNYLAAERERMEAPKKAVQAREVQVAEQVSAFFAAFKRGEKDSQWKSTPAGLKYIVVEEGSGKQQAKVGDLIKPHYYGVFASDGQMFDNSFKRGEPYPFTIGAQEVIAGWEEGFQQLKTGDKAYFLIPPQLAYGAEGYPGAIPPDATLIFYVEVESINGE
jgi:FKBP-type peptidyl-prolyl cis-trans isomerase